jgi:CDP-6-deoxy-D-xylo-4-hexulose-3-dehydrase
MPINNQWPLMKNNISRLDLDTLIEYLKQDDPKLTHGPKVKAFESAWSEWLGVKYSVMLNSGASANDLTMLALRELRGIGEVIVPGLTWVSDIASVLHAGHTPVFVDIDKRSLAMDAAAVIKAITPKTKAVFLTHILGLDGLTDELLQELELRQIPLIEDVCESHGATHNGKKVGSFGWASNFSFYYAHHMTTIEGGIVSTNDFELYELMRMMRSHGMARESSSQETKEDFAKNYPDLNPDFIFVTPAHNMRPNELNGILGLSQLPRLDEAVEKRSLNYKKFLSGLDPQKFEVDFKTEGNSNYAFILVLKEPDFEVRDKVERELRNQGIEFRRGLSGGGNQLRQPYLRRLSDMQAPESLPNVDHVHHFGWYIGNYPDINPDIFSAINLALRKI